MSEKLEIKHSSGERFKDLSGYTDTFELSEDELSAPILDVGAGAGDFIKATREKFSNANARAFDIFYRGEGKKPDWFDIGDAESLPYEPNQFRTVVSSAMVPIFLDGDTYPESYSAKGTHNVLKLLSSLLEIVEDEGSLQFDIPNPKLITPFRYPEQTSENQEIQKQYTEHKKINTRKFIEHLRNLPYKVGFHGSENSLVVKIIKTHKNTDETTN